jgi:uncharacterized protein
VTDTDKPLKPIPPADADSRAFWQGANDGRFLAQRCGDCGRAQFYPRSVCRHCQSTKLADEACRGTGKVASYSVVHRAPIPSFRPDAPYVVALVDLDEGVRFLCNVVGCAPGEVRIGDAIELVFEERDGSTQRIPQARRVASASV